MPLPRVVPVILSGGFLRRLLSPIVALRFFGRGRAETPPAFKQATIPLGAFKLSRCVVAAPVKQPMTSRFLVGPCTGMLQRSFRDTPALSEQFRSQGVSLTGGWMHPWLPTVRITSLLVF